MLSTASSAKSSNVGISQVVQLFVPATNPRAENSFYKFCKKLFRVSTMCTLILGF